MDSGVSIISIPIIVTIIVFAIMVFIPFFIAFTELMRPRDNQPLFIEMLNLKDPLYFGKSFKKLVGKNIEKTVVNPDTESEIQLSKLEKIEVAPSKSLPRKSKITHILYVSESLETEERVVFSKEIYTKGKGWLGPQNMLRSIYGEENITIGPRSKVTRWICSEGNLTVGDRCYLGRNAAAEGQFTMDIKCRFHGLFGRPIITVRGISNVDMSFFSSFRYPEYHPVKRESSWKIYQKHVSVNCPVDTDEDEANPTPVVEERQWRVTDSYVRILPHTLIYENFISRRNLFIGEGCTIHGCIKSYGNIQIGRNSIVYGNVFAEGDIKIENNCIILGHVFSQSGIYISNGVKISRPDTVKSVIGKKRIELGHDVIIFGYLLTEGVGVVHG